MSAEVKVLENEPDLLQVVFPYGACGHWEGGIHIGMPGKPELYYHEWSKPKAYIGERGELCKVKKTEEKIPLVIFEVAASPRLALENASKFGGIGIDLHESLRGRGNMEILEMIAEKMDYLRTKGKCKNIFVAYRLLPVFLPADCSGFIGVMVYTHLAMVGC